MVQPEVEAGRERRQRAARVAARAVRVGERHGLVPVRQEGAPAEQLQRGQDRRQRPERQQVRDRHPERDRGPEERGEHGELAPPEVGPHEVQVPRPEARRVRGVEVGVEHGAGMAVVRVMRRPQPVVREARVQHERDAADRVGEPSAGRRERAVHRVVRDDEEPRAQPALQRDHRQRGERRRGARRVPAPVRERRPQQRGPRGEDRRCEREADARVAAPSRVAVPVPVRPGARADAAAVGPCGRAVDDRAGAARSGPAGFGSGGRGHLDLRADDDVAGHATAAPASPAAPADQGSSASAPSFFLTGLIRSSRLTPSHIAIAAATNTDE